MHKFFKGSRKTIAAMMAILMFTSSTGTYAQTGIIQSSVPDVNTVEEQGDAVDPVVTQESPEDTEDVLLNNEPSEDSSEDVDSDKDTSVSDETDNNAEEQTSASEADTENVTELPETTQEDLSEKVERFIQKEKSYEAMEEIDNMQELLAEMDEQELYELLYFMRMSFLCEVQESPDQTLDTYYEILEAYLEVKSGEEWKDVIFPYLPYYEEGMTEEDYLETISKDSKLDILNMNDVLSSLETGGDPAEGKSLEECEKEAVITIAAECVVQGGPEDAVWTMYHYGYVTDTVMQLEDTDAFFGKLSNPYVFNKLAAYEYYESSPEDFTEKAELLRKYYKDGNTDDTTLLKYLNEKNDTSYESVEAYEKLLGADFSEVMEAWNAYLSGKTDTLSRKLDTDTGESTKSTEESTENTEESQDSTVKENNETSTETDETTELEVTETMIEDICGYNVTENPFMFTISVKRGKKDSIKEKLPSTLTILANGKEEEIPVTWKATEDVDKTDYNEYMYQLVLPNGYVFSDELSEVAQNYGFSSPYVLVKIINSSKVIVDFPDKEVGENIAVPYYALEDAENRMPAMILALLEGSSEPELIPISWELDYDYESEEDAVLYRAVLEDGYSLKDDTVELPIRMVYAMNDGSTGGIATFAYTPSSSAQDGGTWKQDSNGWWYLNPDGKTYPNNCWAKINSHWYYFKSNGYMAANQWVGEDYVDGNGYWTIATVYKESTFESACADTKVTEIRIGGSFTASTSYDYYFYRSVTILPKAGVSPTITLSNSNGRIIAGSGSSVVIRDNNYYRITFSHSTSSSNCGTVCAFAGSNLTVESVNFSNSSSGCWAIHGEGGNITVHDCNFDSAYRCVGVLNKNASYVPTIKVTNSSFCSSGSSWDGDDGIHINNANSGLLNLHAEGNTFKNKRYGIVYWGVNNSNLSAAPTVTIKNNTVSNCSSMGISCSPGGFSYTAYLYGNNASYNNQVNIDVSSAAWATLDQNTTTGSTRGVQLINCNGVDIYIANMQNAAIGLYTESSTVNFYSGISHDNSQNGIYIASGWLGMYGGSVYNNSQQGVYSNSLFHLAGGEIRNNNDRGVYINAGTFGMEGGSIHDNTCGGVGGGVYINSGATYNLAGGSIYSNHTDKTGGGIHSEGNLSMTAGTIHDNSASGEGGGIYTVDGSSSTVSGGSIYNNSAVCGGGIENYGSMDVGSVSITGNTASRGAGGFFSDATATSVLNGTNISNNTAGVYGGGVANYGSLKLYDVVISGNKVTGTDIYGGGGLFIGNNSTVYFYSGRIDNNTVGGNYGGGVRVLSGSALNMSGGSVYSNSSVFGGGIFSEGTLNITGGSIRDNDASDNGGGIYAAGPLSISGGTINNNKSGEDGGGIAAFNNVDFTGGTIADNTADWLGGNIHVHATGDKTAVMTVSSTNPISGGTALGGGGGISVYGSGAKLVLNDGTSVTGNTAKWGGGICANGTVEMKNSTISGNKVADTEINNGGGVNIFSDENGTGQFIMSSGVIENNTATLNGGGICNTGNLLISGGTITTNTAETSGGGIYSGGSTTMTGGTIASNTSKTGLAQAYYQNGTLTVGADAEITGDIYLPVDHIINVDTDLTKANLEVSLAEDDTVAKRVIAEYSADTTSYKAGTDDTARYSLETATAGYASAKSLKIDDNSTAGSVYQVWLDTSGVPVRVHYIGRNAESGTEKADIVQPGTENYQVQHNAGYTGYARKGYTFTGWTVRVNLPTVSFSEKNTDYLSYDELARIANDQKDAGITGDMFTKTTASTSVAGFALRAARNFAVGLFLPVEVQAAEEYMDVYMLDVWDKAPEIKWTENTFYEGVDVFRTDLLGNIQIKDYEDGTISTENLVIESITYSAGKLVNGVKEASYTVDYTNGMKDTDKLDTWFMQLDKADSPVTHTLHCSVTDSAGNMTKADIPVKVKYNEFPTIDAQDRYFTLEEAQSGAITKNALLADAIADDKLSADDTEEGNISSRITMVDYDLSDFTSFEDSGYVTITLHVQDSMGPDGKGKETYRQIKVFVVKDGLVPEVEKAHNVRFISKKYYDRNKDVDLDTLSEEEKEARNSNGGLNVESKWYHEADYRTLIEGTFGKTEGTVYEFDKEDIDNIKAFVDANGIGALDTFYNQFVAPAKIS